MKEIIYYQCENGKIPYFEWYKSLDKSLRIIVDKRISKIERGLYGDYKRLSEELYEFRFSNGLRIYYTEKDDVIVLLLNGGSKSKQSKDIETAQNYIVEFNKRMKTYDK